MAIMICPLPIPVRDLRFQTGCIRVLLYSLDDFIRALSAVSISFSFSHNVALAIIIIIITIIIIIVIVVVVVVVAVVVIIIITSFRIRLAGPDNNPACRGM